MLTEKDLVAIEARNQARTRGRWRVLDEDGAFSLYAGDDPDNAAKIFMSWPNARFIAHATNDIPRLIAEIRRLKGTPS